MLEQFKKFKIFSANPTPIQDIVKYKRASLISLKGVEPYVQEIFVAGLLKNLFEARKKEEIPPFFLVLEEAHNFCPERSFGELRSSKIIRTLAGEGRKFGIGLCVISQRPAKVDKNVVSQCTTQVLLKISNPNDLKSVIASSEGVDSDSENEIQKLNIGTCLLTGVIDIPLKVNIRPRVSKHGGETVDITLPYEVEEGMLDENGNIPSYSGSVDETNDEISNREAMSESNKPKTDFYKGENSEFIQFVAPEIEAEDAKVMLDADQIEVQLVPASMLKLKTSEGKEVNILYDRVNAQIIKSVFPYEGSLARADLSKLTDAEKKLIPMILNLSDLRFNPAELLLKTDVMYNEILRVCDTLTTKGILKKVDKQYEVSGLAFLKKLDELNFYGSQKFEEISYDKKLDEVLPESAVKELFGMFATIENIKEIYILRYVGR